MSGGRIPKFGRQESPGPPTTVLFSCTLILFARSSMSSWTGSVMPAGGGGGPGIGQGRLGTKLEFKRVAFRGDMIDSMGVNALHGQGQGHSV